jgi:5,10-methylenetetrahydromethanopterin reductase
VSVPSTKITAAQLGCYVLPGGVTDSLRGVAEARSAEAIGLGAVWIGERYDTKDLPSLAGAISQVTTRVQIGAAITHTGLRHPMVLASMGQTLQGLSGGRFSLGFGRSAAWRWIQYGVAAPTLASMGDTAEILRKLWAGETVTYHGPAGDFPELRLPQRAPVAAPPVLLAAVGPATLACAGRSFDGAILHPFVTPEAVARSVAHVRRGAEAAGRDPAACRVIATVVSAPGCTAEETDLAIGARAAGYLQLRGLGDAIAAINGWSPADMATYRAQPKLAALGDRSADKTLTRPELIELSRTLPDGWLRSSSAQGTAAQCATTLRAYLDAGASDVILHGSTAESLGPLVDAFARGS